MKDILHENQSPVQEILNEVTAQNVMKENAKWTAHKKQLSEANKGNEQGNL